MVIHSSPLPLKDGVAWQAPTRHPCKPQRGNPSKLQGAQPCKGDQTLGKLVRIRIEPYGGDPYKPQRGDPFKAQGAQPCKGDQTLGQVVRIRMEPYRAAPLLE